MATHLDLTDMCDDIDFKLFPEQNTARHNIADLGHKVQSLQAEVDMLQQGLHESLDLHKNILKQWTQQTRPIPKEPAAQVTYSFPQAASTPYVPSQSIGKKNKPTQYQAPLRPLELGLNPNRTPWKLFIQPESLPQHCTKIN